MGKVMLEGYCNKCYVKEQSTRLNQAATRAPGTHSPPLVMVSVSLPLTQGSVAVHHILICRSFFYNVSESKYKS